MNKLPLIFPIQRWRDAELGDAELHKLLTNIKADFRAPGSNPVENRNFCAKCAYCIRFFLPSDCASVVMFHPQQRKSFVRGGWGSRFDGFILGFADEKAPPKPIHNHAKHVCDSCIIKKLESGGFNVVYVPAVGYVTADTGKFDPTPEAIAEQLQAARVG